MRFHLHVYGISGNCPLDIPPIFIPSFARKLSSLCLNLSCKMRWTCVGVMCCRRDQICCQGARRPPSLSPLQRIFRRYPPQRLADPSEDPSGPPSQQFGREISVLDVNEGQEAPKILVAQRGGINMRVMARDSCTNP